MTIYVRDTDLAKRYNVHRVTIWSWARKGLLPPPIKISAGVTRWRLDEVEARDAEREGKEAVA